jgi:hypothetical protein
MFVLRIFLKPQLERKAARENESGGGARNRAAAKT